MQCDPKSPPYGEQKVTNLANLPVSPPAHSAGDGAVLAQKQIELLREVISVADFKATSSFAQIKQIRIPPPTGALTSYNDDVHVTPYAGALDSYMSAQRPNLNIDDLGAGRREAFFEQAILQHFPLAEIPSIPAYLTRSLNFLLSNSPDAIAKFRPTQLDGLRSLAADRSGESAQWYQHAPRFLGEFHRRFPLGVWASLMTYFNIQGTNWLGQMVHGFSIVGDLSQQFTFPPAPVAGAGKLSESDVLDSAEICFRLRSKRPPQQAGVLRKEALGQVPLGWLGAPRKLSTTGAFLDDPLTKVNISFRFAVQQSSKVRAYDDLKQSLINRLCSISTPITLPDWDLIASMNLLIAQFPTHDWAFLKGG